MIFAALTPLKVLDDVGLGLKEGFFMFWDTVWAMILGFTLSGIVQAFASRASMQKKLGNHRAPAVMRASGFGAVSSSCSYAASAMAKSLFVKGADFVSSMIFMFSSTNLVIELGIVIIVLIGWQFAIAEFVGGTIMIVLLALLGGLFFTTKTMDSTRTRLNRQRKASKTDEENIDASDLEEQSTGEPWSKKLRSKPRWADAASYTIADLTMLRREIFIGFIVAGFLAALVPSGLWNAVFIHGHGWWTTIENAAVGPFIALISFVCSIGNIPLAAALWKGGISFGGVVSFIFADLISLPLVLIYRKFYGGRIALRLLGVFWILMAAAGFVTDLIFHALGLIPTVRPTHLVPEHISFNYTTVLNIVFLAIFIGLYWMHRQRGGLSVDTGRSIDPVCGMQVERSHAPANVRHSHNHYFFCSDRCAERFKEDPERFVSETIIDEHKTATDGPST